jgi:hypothetical protein
MSWLSGEPTIDEMLVDPTVITMMKRDGVKADDVRRLIRDVSGRLKRDIGSTVHRATWVPAVTQHSRNLPPDTYLPPAGWPHGPRSA